MNKERQQPLLDHHGALTLVAQLLEEVHLGGVQSSASYSFWLEVVCIDRHGVVEAARDERTILFENPADELEPLSLLDFVENPISESSGPFPVQVLYHGSLVVMDDFFIRVLLEHMALVGQLIQ